MWLNIENDDFDLWKVDGGTSSSIDENGPSLGSGQYWVEVEWTTGDGHNIDLYDSDPWGGSPTPVVSISVTDATFTSGDVGMFWDTSGATVSVDDIRKVT